ncbi:MAG: phosphoenolpyruvate--protein phosphotransferase [Acidobacteriota bacterium]|nr:phosphoenolpyruvate--protein phosphotransferase [Acidobacteriota bacterium]
MERLTGIGVSGGIATGRAVVLMQGARAIRFRIPAAQVATELAALAAARERSRRQLQEIRARVAETRGGELAALFDAQLLMLDDPMLLTRAEAIVRDQQVNAEWAVQQVFEDLGSVFDAIEDPYLRERKGDLADVIGRLRLNLRSGLGTPRDLLNAIDGPCVLVCDELTPSVAAQVDWGKVQGFATDAGSRTYHTAILARSLDVPAVVGLHDASRRIPAGATLVLDGATGEVLVEPSREVLDDIALRAGRQPVSRTPNPQGRRGPGVTADGVLIRLEANIELPGDLETARECGAQGIGLYRSEFLLAETPDEADEEERQYEMYRRLVEGMAPEPVTIRTFDVDEDQLATRERRGATAGWSRGRGNPLGLRGMRLCLTRRELFRTQLRALLRAGRHGRLRIMFPFVSGVEQLREARAVVAEAGAELAARGEDVPDVPIGVMIEIPAAAYVADLLAREVAFCTIGTNDLIQYCLAVDRADERVSRLYEPLHPAILRLIALVRRASDRRGIPVSLCGEMASDPALLALLVGLGLREFSMTPAAIPVARQLLAGVSAEDMRRVAREALRLPTVDAIERRLLEVLSSRPAGATAPAGGQK